MHRAEVQIVADSVSNESNRLITYQLRYWRAIHAEVMTHRVFSRNAGSSRARPSLAIIKQVFFDPWGPIHWGKNEPGMQANTELQGIVRSAARNLWCLAAKAVACIAYLMLKLKVHKQIVNRILEPFTYIEVLVTATDYANWFYLRDHADAQPEIKDLAEQMLIVKQNSTPRFLFPSEWHLPYITGDDRAEAVKYLKHYNEVVTCDEILALLKKMSTARCARISYSLFDGTKASLAKDLALYKKLIESAPLHASPTEHQATPDTMTIQYVYRIHPEMGNRELINQGWAYDNPHLHGNLKGWVQYRKTLANEFIPG